MHVNIYQRYNINVEKRNFSFIYIKGSVFKFLLILNLLNNLNL